MTDPSLLERIVGNLVANAIRYTNRGGVLVGARRCGERVAIDVVDTGIGIARADRDRVFEEFFQVRSERASSPVHRGMGLGLAIVRRFAALLGHDDRARFATGASVRAFACCCPASPRVKRVLTDRAPRNPWRRTRTTSARCADGWSRSSTTIRQRSTRCAHCSRRGVRLSSAARRRMRCWPASDEFERYPDLIVADLRLARRPLRHRSRSPVARRNGLCRSRHHRVGRYGHACRSRSAQRRAWRCCRSRSSARRCMQWRSPRSSAMPAHCLREIRKRTGVTGR